MTSKKPSAVASTLTPDEIMRVMDVAEAIRVQREALSAHEAFDREAAIRDVQTLYEELGDLVERDVIERALDEHLSQRFAFAPSRRGPWRAIALLYVRRGAVARRVLLPAAALLALAWTGMQGVELAQRYAAEREVRRTEARIERLAALESEVARLAAAAAAAAVEDEAHRRLAALEARAEAQATAGALDELTETVARLEALRDQVSVEAELVVVGGVWRRSNDDPSVRNHYLRVQALDPADRPVPFLIRSEEDGTTGVVREWAERVPKDLYDRVARDKSDNGIVDDELFGRKRMGYVTVERRYEELGQIREW